MPFRKTGLAPPDETVSPAATSPAVNGVDVKIPVASRNATRKGRGRQAAAKPVTVEEAPAETPVTEDLATRIAALQDPDPVVRQTAIRALEGKPEALTALATQLAVETDGPTRETLALLLSRADGTDVAGCLLPLLRSRDAELRSITVEILSHQSAGINPRLSSLLSDPDPHFRTHMLMIVKLLPVVEDATVLADLLRNDPDINVVASVLDIIHDRQTEVHLSDMQTLVGSLAERFPDQPFIRFAVNRILKISQSSPR